MTAEITELITRLSMDSSEFQTKVKEAEVQVQEFAASSQSAVSKVAFGFGTAAVLGVALLSEELAEAADRMNDVYETSQKINIAPGKLQELQDAFKGFGVNGEQVTKSIQFMQRAIGEAQKGTAQFADTFKELGLNVKDLAQLSPEEQLQKIANSIKNVNDITLQQADARKIFGRGGSQLIGAIRGGVDNAIDSFKGTAADDQAYDRVHKLVEELNHASASFRGWINELLGNIASVFASINEHIKATGKSLQDIYHGVGQTGTAINAAAGRGVASVAGLGEWHDNSTLLDHLLGKILPDSWSDQGKYGKNIGANENLLGNNNINTILGFGDSTARVTTQASQSVQKLSDAADDAADSLDKVSSISDMIDKYNKNTDQAAIKALLGDHLGNGQQDFTKAGDIFDEFKDQFQHVFDDVKTNGLTDKNRQDIADLRREASSNELRNTGIDATGVLNAVNDLEKFGKEQQAPKKDTIELIVHWEKGLNGQATMVTTHSDLIYKSINDAVSSAAAAIGK